VGKQFFSASHLNCAIGASTSWELHILEKKGKENSLPQVFKGQT